MRNLFFALTILVCLDTAATEIKPPLEATATGAIFQQSDNLEFTLREDPQKTLWWKLYDWRGNKIQEGSMPPDGRLNLSPLPNGYYSIRLYDGDKEFGAARTFAVTFDISSRKKSPNSPYALDSAQSWLARRNPDNPHQPDNAFEIVSDVAAKCGAYAIRERMSWGESESSKGKFSWGNYQTNADLLSQRGIGILGMYHDSPLWARGKNTKLPSDLTATYSYAKELASHFKGKMIAWEFWNEEDISFTQESAWEYAANMKAAYLGFKAGNPDIPVLLGSLCKPLDAYANAIFECGLENYMDIFNYHIYMPVSKYPRIMQSLRDFSEKYAFLQSPIWITENGTNHEGSAKENSPMEGIKSHSFEQELIVAEQLPKQMILLQFLGADRIFGFVLPPYNERGGSKDWGYMRRDFTVKPAISAFSTLTFNLAAATPLGELKLNNGVRAFLYLQPDGTQTVVLWSKSEIDNLESENPDSIKLSDNIPIQLQIPLEASEAKDAYFGFDIMGSPLAFNCRDGILKLTATRFPMYINGLRGLAPDIKFKNNKTPGAPNRPDLDKTIVYRAELNEDFKLQAMKHMAFLNKPTGKIVLEIYNFSDEEKSGAIDATGGDFKGLPDSLKLPPMSKTKLELSVSPKEETLVFCGRFNGKNTTPLKMAVASLGFLDSLERKTPANINDPSRWRANASGKMKIEWDETEKALRFDVEFPDGVDQWVYPEFAFKDGFSIEGAKYATVEVKSSVGSKLLKQSLLMCDAQREGNTGKSEYFSSNLPDKQWQTSTICISPQKIDAKHVKKIKFGLNVSNKTKKVSYWIRNLTFYYGKKTQ